MKFRIFAIALLALLFAPMSVRAVDDSVLLWFIDNVPGVENRDGSYTPLVDLPGWSAGEDNTLAARVRMDSASGGSIYLDMWYYDEASRSYIKDLGLQEAWVNEQGQTGVNYSSIPGGVDLASINFVIELGNLEEDGAGNLIWQQTLAWSQLASGNELYQAGHISPGELAIPDHTPWSDLHFTSVPEPTSGLLVAIGGLLLALRRRRRGGQCSFGGGAGCRNPLSPAGAEQPPRRL